MSYIISGLLIAVFVIWELTQFKKVVNLVALYQDIFPDDLKNLDFEKDELLIRIQHHSSEVFLNIVGTLNRYLGENSNQVSDYHLMKDVVDRNREVSESEIETIIPFTQYIGLVGTMLGIFVGVIHLVFGGGLKNLMAGSGASLASSGVPELLGGVALAVLTSAVGLGLTMRSSYLFKEAKRIVELRENAFLGWIQSELLPNLSTDMTSALVKMTTNLRDFNNTFSSNTEKLDKALAHVNESYVIQSRLLQQIDRVDVVRVATANITVYEKLKSCTTEIGLIGEALKNTREFLEEVKKLTEKLDDADERARTWEKMGKFFETEINEIENRKAAISEAVGNVDDKLQSSFEHLRKTSANEISSVEAAIAGQNEKLEKALDKQEGILNRRLEQMSDEIDKRNRKLADIFTQLQQVTDSLPNEMKKYTKELSNLGAIKQGILDLQTIIFDSSKNKVVTGDGVVIKNSGSEKIPVSIMIAIFVIAIYSIIMIVKELPSFIQTLNSLL